MSDEGPVTNPGRHAVVAERLSEHLDGLLGTEEAGAVERHLAECEACRRTLGDLERIRDAARHLLEDRPPERDLWPGIRDAIGASTLVLPLPDRAAATARRRGPGLFLSAPQIAAAAVLLLAVGAGGASLVLPGGAGDGAPTEAATPGDEPAAALAAAGAGEGVGAGIGAGYAAEVERLEELLETSRDGLKPGTVRVLERNLAVIDRAILESMQALEADPANPWVRDHLRRSWERKVDYLRQAADLVEWSATD